jgi:predicted MPP superfamily phosphohydrolase
VPAVRRVEIALARWPRAFDGFRIVQISDIHIGPLLGRGFARALSERVNALAPDLVAVTGDLVDGPVESLREEVAPFAELRGRHGVFFVTGNHDVYSGGEPWVEHVRALGMRPLRNERIAIGGDAGFDLAGVDDHRGDWMHGSSEDLGAALAGRDPSRPVVLLAHDPGSFRRASAEGVDLQLSGHTHGGQIWPFNFLVRLAVPWVAGLHRVGSSLLYVSRGSGFWGPPMRLLAPAEITELVLRPR